MTIQELRQRLESPEVQLAIARADIVLVQFDDLAPAVAWGCCTPYTAAVASVCLLTAPDTEEGFNLVYGSLHRIKGGHREARNHDVAFSA